MKNLFRLFLVFSIVIIGVVSFQAIDASANETDVITQDDVDAVTSLGLGYFTNYLTDEDLQMLGNA
ncbi:hypothetical protein BLG61_02750, partial [Listeria monocytogenes]|nr:hypothetical protein [Listeria monocytogenes]